LGSDSRFKLQETFSVFKYPDFNNCMDLFIVDYGIESSDNFREKRSSWVMNEPKYFSREDASCPLTDKILEKNIPMSFNRENSAALATTTLVASAVTRFYSY